MLHSQKRNEYFEDNFPFINLWKELGRVLLMLPSNKEILKYELVVPADKHRQSHDYLICSLLMHLPLQFITATLCKVICLSHLETFASFKGCDSGPLFILGEALHKSCRGYQYRLTQEMV